MNNMDDIRAEIMEVLDSLAFANDETMTFNEVYEARDQLLALLEKKIREVIGEDDKLIPSGEKAKIHRIRNQLRAEMREQLKDSKGQK